MFIFKGRLTLLGFTSFIGRFALAGLVLATSACQQMAMQPARIKSVDGNTEISAVISTDATPKNIILMIGDGMGPSHISALRYFNDDPNTQLVESLVIDPYLVGSLRTSPHGIKGQVTDSAASATAYATGHKTINGALSVLPTGEPVQTVLEYAHQQGRATGLVSTSQINHATPAAFASHQMKRSEYLDIARQMATNSATNGPIVDVMLGGGLDYFHSKDQDLVGQLTAQGYQFAQTKTQLHAMDGDRLLGLFAPVGLSYAIDRTADTPSLADMSEKALQALAKNQQGFFLMIEGSEIDWAAHGNDVVGVISELEDFMAAIKRVEAFVKKHPDTLVLITADHATGGISIGREVDGKSYYQWKPALVASFKHSADWIASDAKISGNLLTSFNKATSIKLTRQQQQLLARANPQDEKANINMVTRLISELTLTGWTTHGHTGVDVNLYAFGAGAELFRGHHDNTFIGKMIFKLLGKK